MWAQLIRVRLKPDKDMAEMTRLIRAAEQPGSGLFRTLVMRDQTDPSQVYTLVVFESEEKARAREQDPRRRQGLDAARSITGVTGCSPSSAACSPRPAWS
jgi:hypothetical protein